MNEEQSKLYEQPTPDLRENQLLVKDILTYFSSLAKLNDAEKTGNLELSQALRDLTKSLRRFSNHPVSELTTILHGKVPTNGFGKHPNNVKVTLPPELEDVSQDVVEKILEDGRYTKIQVAELGFRRFGISHAKLVHLSKKDALESVRAALGHERSLDAISQEARKGGMARSS